MLELQDIQAAAARLSGQVLDTPFVESRTISQLTGCQVFLKFENLQYTASFKERGACNKLAQLGAEERARGVIAMSAGNHAQGVAYHAQRLGLRAVIVMPRFTPGVKVERTRGFGAEVVLHGDSLDESRTHARELATQEGLVFVHPYDDEDIVAGQGTVALEMLREQPDLDTLVVAIGGGGLIAGMATAAKAIKPGIEVIGVQTERFPAMVNAIKGTHLPQGTSTIAEGIAVGTPGVITESIVRQKVDDLLLVDEGDIEQAIVMLLASIIERGMVRAGRLARIQVNARDVPGNLARITATVADAGANIDEVHHQRAFTLLAAQNVAIELVLQTRGREHIAQVIERLQQAGFETALL